MLRTILKSKIHRATVTEANLHYEGSITIDAKLMQAADILEYEKVEVLNINNGRRLETYAIKAKAGSARGACVGDKLVILTYIFCAGEEPGLPRPKIVKVNERNRIKN